LRRYFSTDGYDICWIMIRACFGSVANMAIVPMQDVLCLDSWARMNTPGVGEGNWAWRYKEDALTHKLEARLYETCKMFGR
jgi:4-alpha-glucanotransferase